MTAAAIADANRAELESWYVRTVEDGADVASGAGNFSMRGMMGCDAAAMVDAGHVSFTSPGACLARSIAFRRVGGRIGSWTTTGMS